MLAFVEAFRLMGIVFLLVIPFLPLLQYSKAKRASSPIPESSKRSTSPEIPEAWPEAVPEETGDEEHELVLH